FRIAGAICLEVIKLTSAEAWNEDAPNIAPAVIVWTELDDLFRLEVLDVLIEQEPHRRRTATIDDELDAILVKNGAVRQHVGELEGRMDVSHEHEERLDSRGDATAQLKFRVHRSKLRCRLVRTDYEP